MTPTEAHRSAVLLPFPPPEGRAGRGPSQPDGPAAILLFTGVRYERLAPEAEQTPPRMTGPKRSGGKSGRR